MTDPARHDVHQWAGTDPDHCIVCDVEWSDADLTCTPTAGRAVCALINPWDDTKSCAKDAGHDGLHWFLPIPVDPANWTVEQAQAAQAELDELERTDPDVAAAAASYDRMVERMTGRPMPLLNEPTDADRRVVADIIDAGHSPTITERRLARALADQRAAIHAQYEQLAKWADAQAGSREHFAKVDPTYRMTLIPYRAMAERIRMVADQ